MWEAIREIVLSLFRIGWLPLLSWIFGLRNYLPEFVQEWLSVNNDPIFVGAIVGTIVWGILMTIHELPRFRHAYYRLHPQIQFKVTRHNESGQFAVIEGRHILIGVGVYIEGYFENSGGSPSTVKAIETQLFKKRGIFKFPVGKKGIKAAYYLEGEHDLVDPNRGCYVDEYSVSRMIKADSICLCNGECRMDKLGNDYCIRVRWHVLGQAPKDTEIYPDWESFKRDVTDFLSRRITDKGDYQG